MKYLVRVSAVLLFTSVAAFAGPDRLNFGRQINAAQCDPNSGKLVINVVQHVTNDADSGFASPVWAFDDFTRQIQVRQTGANTFCATVKYQGSWTTVAGPSPMGTGTINAGLTGTFEGGYITGFTGTLKANPTVSTRGNIGSVNYACDTSGNCPGFVDWTTFFFDSTNGFENYSWWGWIYHGGDNGTWVNASSGSSGDIHN